MSAFEPVDPLNPLEMLVAGGLHTEDILLKVEAPGAEEEAAEEPEFVWPMILNDGAPEV